MSNRANDVVWPTEVRGHGRGVGWLNKLLRACKQSVIQDVKFINGSAKIQNGILILSGNPRGATGTSGGLNYRGLWTSGTTYNENDLVLVQTGTAAGGYISTIDSNNNDPATGIGWMQWPQTQSVGSWT